MKLIIAGGRKYQLTIFDRRRLDVLNGRHWFTEEVCGDATGADTGGRWWALSRGIPVYTMPADWTRFHKVAGFIRNREMGEYVGKGGVLVAFPGNRGTAHMVEVARDIGLFIYDWRFPGDNQPWI